MVNQGADLDARVAARVAGVAETLQASLPELGRALHAELAQEIPELRGDPIILDLLHASVVSNVESFLHVARYDIGMEDVRSPAPAVEYARRLAQRGISSNALVRAYRLGQRRIFNWAFAEVEARETDGAVALAAAKVLHETAFAYVDKVTEHVVLEYERERERWLANRNTVRATTLAELLRGQLSDAVAAETALGYRMRQHHLGVVLWTVDDDAQTEDLHRIESVLGAIGEAVGAVGHPFSMPQDRALGWGWIPLGRAAGDVPIDSIARVVKENGSGVRVALGTPAAALPGFRSTHVEALRAHAVAAASGDRAQPVTSYGDPGVRAASLLVHDLVMTREMVTSTLGGLASDDEATERLRETLLMFLSEKGSFQATAERIHLHRNTVRYRVEKAAQARGRGIDDDRLNLELALLACHWLGRSVLA